MALETVFFGLLNDRFETTFDRSQLRIGRIVYVTFDAIGKPQAFSVNKSEYATPYCISWISPSEWYVVLRTRPVPEPELIDRVTSAVGGYLSRDVVEGVLYTISQDIPLEQVFKSSAHEESRLHLVKTVVERLDLVKRLQEQEVSKALWMHDTALSVYLLLTCFDRLGQPADWLPFDAWLAASRTSHERVAALKILPADTPHIEAAKALTKWYNDQYGVRSSFFRFLHEVLPDETRRQLLSSIEIEVRTLPPRIDTVPPVSHQDKEKYLLKLRNDYTHKSHVRTRAGSEDELSRHFQSDNRNTWFYQEHTVDAEKWTTIRTFGWPYTLENAVRVGLAAYMNKIALEAADSERRA